MKSTLISFLFFFSLACNAQPSNEVSFDISLNQIGVGYQYNFKETPLWCGMHFGLSNQDKFNSFNDPVPELQVGYTIYSFGKSKLYSYISGGLYFTNNNYYSVKTSFFGIFAGYEKKLGQQQKHAIFAESGYRHGKNTYAQIYENKSIYLVTKDLFSISPVIFLVGYSYRF